MSDWKQGAAKRRDDRATKEDLIPNHNPGKKSKKNTKRWCKGKEGMEHIPKKEFKVEMMGKKFFVLICENCGKKLKWVTENRIGKLS